MFDIQKIIKRSWHILWNYRMLWVFGFILAVALGGSNPGNNSRYNLDHREDERPYSVHPPDDWKGLQGDTPAEKLQDAFRQIGEGLQKLQAQHPDEFRLGVGVAITLFVVALLFGILLAVLRYVAEVASIRMVDEYEQSGVKVGFRQGWKYGWSPAAWRAFLVNFIVHLPVLALFVILGLVSWWILSAFISEVEANIISSLIAGSGLAFLFIFITAILMVLLLVLRDFAWRMIALEGAETMESLRMALALVKRQWKNIGLMWLVMVGLKIAWTLAFFIMILPLLIVSIITAVGGILAAIVPTLLTAGIASLFSAPGYWPWIFAAVIGMPFFLIVTFSPVILASGWSRIYETSAWTLTYRELKALEAVKPQAAQELSAPHNSAPISG